MAAQQGGGAAAAAAWEGWRWLDEEEERRLDEAEKWQRRLNGRLGGSGGGSATRRDLWRRGSAQHWQAEMLMWWIRSRAWRTLVETSARKEEETDGEATVARRGRAHRWPA